MNCLLAVDFGFGVQRTAGHAGHMLAIFALHVHMMPPDCPFLPFEIAKTAFCLFLLSCFLFVCTLILEYCAAFDQKRTIPIYLVFLSSSPVRISLLAAFVLRMLIGFGSSRTGGLFDFEFSTRASILHVDLYFYMYLGLSGLRISRVSSLFPVSLASHARSNVSFLICARR
jgi:hypothetical protein